MVVPDYYKNFRCIGGVCGHNCCIGWEIDIDPESAVRYAQVSGPMGKRLKENIAQAETPHFILGQGERCPFLNGENLCDLILGLGEDSLCQICRDHPRFFNILDDRTEAGLGLCCEEAGRLILGKESPVILEGAAEEETGILQLRQGIFCCLQDRSRPVELRVDEMLRICGTCLPKAPLKDWAELFLSLERLDESWTKLLRRLQNIGLETEDFAAFSRHMAGRETEYEQFLVYLIYRHFAAAESEADAAARAAFAALGFVLLRALGAMIYKEQGAFSFEDQVELARLFSSEIEYSDENLDILLDCLYCE